MDWSKAKTILIIALLVTCLALGGLLLFNQKKEADSDKASADAAKEYLENQGVSLICDIPLERPKLPVLFLNFYSPSSSEGRGFIEEYDSYPLICEGEGIIINRFAPELKSAGKTKAKVCTASSALLSACSSFENIKNLQVKEINLVYYIQLTDVSEGLEDTAIPSWQIVTDRGSLYINAFVQ